MSDGPRHRFNEYRDAGGLLRLLVCGLVLESLTSVATAALQLGIMSPTFGAVPMQGSELAPLLSAALIANVAGWLLAGGAYVAWVRCIIRNSRCRGARAIRRSPWAGAWIFVPVAHLWMPFLVAIDLWRGSDGTSDGPRELRLRMTRPRSPPLILAWWATRVGSGLWLCLGPLPLATGRDVPAVVMIGTALGVAAYLLQYLVARSITRQQRWQHAQGGRISEDAPPRRAS